jgi:hypothetical protein
MPVMGGKITTGPNKGRTFERYADPASQTGYTQKEYDPNDPSHTEYFSPYNYSADQVDEEQASSDAASRAATAAQRSAQSTNDDAKQAALRQAKLQAGERAWNEGVRQYNTGLDYKNRDLAARTSSDKRANDIRELDARTRLKLGLRELQLKEQFHGDDDMRAREQNVLSYVQAIGKLRLPYPELQALSQRAVAGIVPGGAGGGGAGAGGGALTADQWQALATGTSRDWEQSQAAGQGSALAG